GCHPPPKGRPAAPSRPTPLRGGLTRYPTHYRSAFASSLIPSPLPHQPPLQSAFPRGEATGLLRSSFRSLRGEVVPFGRWRVIRDGGYCTHRTWPFSFWSKPDSFLGLFLFTAFIGTSPGLTCPGRLAPDRRDAGSRRVGSRSHGRSKDRGYVVPRASDLTVAGDARRGSRPMAEHRVMSEDLLGKRITGRRGAAPVHGRHDRRGQQPPLPSSAGVLLDVGLARSHGLGGPPLEVGLGHIALAERGARRVDQPRRVVAAVLHGLEDVLGDHDGRLALLVLVGDRDDGR